MVLEVDTVKAVEGTLDLVATDLEDSLTAKDLRFKRIFRSDSDSVTVVLYEKDTADAVKKMITDKFRDTYQVTPSIEEGGLVGLRLRMKEQDIRDRQDKAVSQALETIRNRIDQFGVSEPVIARQGINQIVIQLPGIKDPQRAIDLIGRTARLEFKLVKDPGDTGTEETEILYEKHTDPTTGAITETPLAVHKSTHYR